VWVAVWDSFASLGGTIGGDMDILVASTSNLFCGDGFLDPGEECDDGNTASGDGCSFVCLIEKCSDGLDNDTDGSIDYPNDPGCTGPLDASEELDCVDGLDNDGDGLVDYPSERAEYGCTWWDDPSEKPQCSDGLDNDRDGDIDYPADPQCMSASWTAEFDQPAEYCGLGAELTLVLAPLMWLYRRRSLRV
jgi:cysteine-rich repeat protein